MASPLVGRAPTCLACLRRITSTTAAPHADASVSIGLTQVRGGKSMQRPQEAGVVIRLLKDVSYFGKEGSIFRTETGRMRNSFFPRGKAEYLTRERMAELGVTKSHIGHRDPNFRVETHEVVHEIEDAVDAIAFATPSDPFAGLIGGPASKQKRGPTPAHAEVEQLAPSRALELLNTLVPEALTFKRRLVHAPASGKESPAAAADASASTASEPDAKAKAEDKKEEEPKRPLTPMQAHRARLQAEADKAAAEKQAAAAARAAEAEAAREAEKTPEERKREAEEREREAEEREREAEELLRFHGSVSLRDVASALKEKMLLDAEASRIHIRPEDLAFVGSPKVRGLDKVETIGTFEVEIRALVGKYKVAPIRRKIEVVPL